MTGFPDDGLAGAARRLRECEAAVRRADGLLTSLRRVQQEVDRLALDAHVEQQDVDRLEGLTLTRVLAGLSGRRDDRLRAEQAEAEAAALRLAEARGRLDAVTAEYDRVRSRAVGVGQARAEYVDLLQRVEQRLIEAGGPQADELTRLTSETGRVRADLAETEEADAAAVAVLSALDRVLERLGSAQGWATYDAVAGGFVAGAIKHARLDEAAQAAADADRRLAVLHRELADLAPGTAGAGERLPEVGGFLRFADLWLDDFFADLAVRRRVVASQEAVAQLRGSVRRLRDRLDDRRRAQHGRLTELERLRGDLITDHDDVT